MSDLQFLILTLVFLASMFVAASYIDDRAGYKASSANPDNIIEEESAPPYFKHEGPGNFTGNGSIYWPDYREV